MHLFKIDAQSFWECLERPDAISINLLGTPPAVVISVSNGTLFTTQSSTNRPY